MTRDPLILRTPTADIAVTRATGDEANAALGSWLYERYRAGCVDPTPRVLQAVALPPLKFNGDTLAGGVVLVDADLVTEVPDPSERRLRIVRGE